MNSASYPDGDESSNGLVSVLTELEHCTRPPLRDSNETE
jgi:hypothetical protein